MGRMRRSRLSVSKQVREPIARELEAESEAMFGREIEVDESGFGDRSKGKRGRGAGGKIPQA
ncbi:MAG: hypothetical protein FJX47_15215 [Alphaproteobacteria bacterium]|nr:hypothetical protein [Alphaproteobacteria bacterium]